MVIRSSFVTNSSSSSFVVVDVKSKEIVNILHEFEEELGDMFEFGGLEFNSDEDVSMFIDEGYSDIPNSTEDLIHVFAGLFDWRYFDEYSCVEDGEELDLSQFSEIVQRLIADKDEIMKNLKAFKLTNGHSGWQGDDDTRFEEDWYEEDTLSYIREEIMEKNGYESIEQITNDDFCEYVCDKTNTEEVVFEYDGETKETKTYRSTSIE